MMKPRSPEQHEFNTVVEFLDSQLRDHQNWSIKAEYPTAMTPNNIHNMSIITDDDEQHILSHALIKPLITKTPQAIYKIAAIGSVVTAPEHRNKGLSTLNMQNCLAKATAQNCDLVVLWTDKHEFYQKFGFELAGFDNTFIIEKKLEVTQPLANIKFVKGPQIDPQALLKQYSNHTVGSVRSLDDIQQYLKIPNTQIYTAWSESNQLLAYAIEGKGLDLQTFIHEWGGQVTPLLQLINHMIEQEGKTYHLMVPQHSINLINTLKLQNVFSHHGYLGMIRIHNFEMLAQKIKKAFRAEGLDQFVLEKQHGQIVFGYGTDLYTLDHESDLTRILFGPVAIDDMNFIKTETRKVLSEILPLPLWIWGWDSI